MRNLIIHILLLVIPLVATNVVMAQNSASTPTKRVVVIDPGHGGPRPGKVLRDVVEKDYVLDVAKKVRKQLNSKMSDLEVYLTRSCDSAYHADRNKDNRLRAEFTNRKNADLYVGIHANALENTSYKGCEVWVLTLNDNLMKQNRLVGSMYADEGDFIDPDDIDRNSQGFIMALSRQLENEPFSRFAAEECCKEMAKYGLKNLGVKVGTVFTVLYYSECPSIIVEMGYLTNKDDYAYLTSKNAKTEMATAISNAIVTYFTTLYGVDSTVDSSAEGGDADKSASETTADASTEDDTSGAKEQSLSEGFTIQLISSTTEVDTSDSQFKEYKGRVRLVVGTGKYKYKYCYGSYKSSADAQTDLKAVRKVFKDAYVVRYKDGAIVVK